MALHLFALYLVHLYQAFIPLLLGWWIGYLKHNGKFFYIMINFDDSLVSPNNKMGWLVDTYAKMRRAIIIRGRI